MAVEHLVRGQQDHSKRDHIASFRASRRARVLLGAAMSIGLGALMVTGASAPAQAFGSEWPRMQTLRDPTITNPFFDAPAAKPAPQETRRARKISAKEAARRKAQDEEARRLAEELREKAKDAPLQILISLSKQELTLYANGEPITTSRVSTGKPGHSTPTGVFAVFEKDRWHRSNLYDNAPMFFMHRLTWGGVALHEGYVPNYPASHGCIRLPGKFARTLWGLTERGVRVIITRDPATPAVIDDPHLTAMLPKAVPVASNPADRGVYGQMKVDGTKLGNVNATELKADDAKSADVKAIQVASRAPLTVAADPNAPDPTDPSIDEVVNLADLPQEPGPISILVSRKDGKIFVRKNFDSLFEAPVTFTDPDQPLGTHVFTTLATDKMSDKAAMRWTVVSMPSSRKQAAAAAELTAEQALARINVPQEALERIAKLIAPGSAYIITDRGLTSETRKGSDFTIITR